MAGMELHEACTLGDFDTLEDLVLSRRYDINLKDPEWKDRTPLHWACTKGFLECIRLLLQEGANPLARMSMGWTPAHCAAEAGKLSVLKTLNEGGVNLWVDDEYGDSPCDVAKIYGHEDCVTYLLSVRDQMESAAQEASTNAQ